MNNHQPTTLIVGASSSFGAAIAGALSTAGHKLILAHSGRKNYQIPVGTGGEVLKFDVTDSQAINEILASLKSAINNVVYSVSAPISFRKFKDEQWQDYEEHWQIQVKGLWHIVQSLLAHNHPLKNIVAIGSAVTLTKPMARLGVYVTAKYALLGLIKALAVELAPLGICVNMLSPEASGTGLSKDWPSLLLRSSNTTTTPEAVARAVILLFYSQNNRTGENIYV